MAPLRKPDTNWLSVSDVEELSASIGQYGALSFDELTNISHAYAWNSALNNKAIALENIMREAGSDEEFIAYITEDINASKEMIGYGVAA
ncbi:MAG: SocA family protein [Prevotellaceae bacterium]|nr:SocA family protein [Prevotellaceae bacterium]